MFVIHCMALLTTFVAIKEVYALIELTTLKCKGTFCLETQENRHISSVFLSRGRLEAIESKNKDSNAVVLCDIFPLPLQYSPGKDLVYSSMNERSKMSLGDIRNDCGVLINRDDGVFDNLPYEWMKGINSKKEIFNYLNGGQGTNILGDTFRFSNLPVDFRSPYYAFQFAVKSFLDAEITGLLLETIDEFQDKSVRIGASILVAKSDKADNWRLSKSNSNLPKSSILSDMNSAVLINCHSDELIGFALATGIPICISNDLFEAAAVDVLMKKESDSGELLITAPYYRRGTSNIPKSVLKKPIVETADPAWEIFDPQRFLLMSMVEKRATLRASNVRQLPRPREGEAALDEMLLNLADDAVRLEVRRLQRKQRQQEEDEDEEDGLNSDPYSSPISAAGEESKRQIVLRQMAEALDGGNMALAEELREKFVTLTALKADPTQPDGSYDRFLDQDDWYLEQRRRAMSPKKK